MRASRFRKSLFLALFFVVAATLLLACSAILGDFDVDPATGPNQADTGTGTDSGSGNNDGSATVDTGTSAEAGDGGDGGDPPTYCDGVVPPPNTAQFLCADFDSLQLGKNWDSVNRTDGGLLEKTQDVAFSAPNALVTGVVGSPAEGVLIWKRPGAKAFEEVTAQAQINPAILGGIVPGSDPLLELIDIRTSNASVTFGYSRGSDALGGGLTYTGYFVTNSVFGGAAAVTHHKISASLPPNVWTELKIVWNRDGKINVTYKGVSVLAVAGYSSTDTVVNVRLGAHVSGPPPLVMPQIRFDNAEFSIRRVP